jgi:hypothetical protein
MSRPLDILAPEAITRIEPDPIWGVPIVAPREIHLLPGSPVSMNGTDVGVGSGRGVGAGRTAGVGPGEGSGTGDVYK